MPGSDRRSFLKIMGLGAAAGPLAMKAAAENEAMQLTTLANRASGQALAGSTASGGPCSDMHPDYIKQLAWSKLNGGKVPVHIEEFARRGSKNIAFIEADIAVKKSWSLAAKIQEQRERNYQREIANLREPNKFEFAQTAFEKLTGFRWRIW